MMTHKQNMDELDNINKRLLACLSGKLDETEQDQMRNDFSMRMMDKDQGRDDVDDIERENLDQPSEEKKFDQQINDTQKLLNVVEMIDGMSSEMSETLNNDVAQKSSANLGQTFKPLSALSTTAKTDVQRETLNHQMRQQKCLPSVSDVFNPFKSKIDEESDEEKKLSSSQDSFHREQ